MAPSDESPAPIPAPIEHYTPEALAACEKALRTIIAKVGAWGPRLILFGGLAPRYLVRSLPEGFSEHTGTTDLDVVIRVQIQVDEPGVYTKLQKELKGAEFAPSAVGSFAWERRVDGVLVVLEFFCPVEPEGSSGALKRNPGGSVGSTVSAIQLRGAELADADCSVHRLSGELLGHGGHRDVEIRVVKLLPFLVLKAFALQTRDKEKDAYDIVWTLSAYGDGGPVSAAEEAVKSPIVDNALVEEAMSILEQAFAGVSDQGPSNYARFFLGGGEGHPEERMRLRRDAHGAVQTFLRRWRQLR